MKQVFYKGLLALTIAFGFTSCDKNDVGNENLQMTQSEVKAGLASKVTFSENGVGISVPKLKGSESSKTHLEFTHIYSPAPQVLSIVNAGNVEQYTGVYAANDISTINPTSILLENGVGYIATSSNVSNTGLGVVSPFLPYTSTVGFDLSESGMITLAATLERGFLIVNGAAEALAGNRISGVTANDVALIKDNDGDFYGYLLAGNHDVVISYTRDGQPATTEDSVDVAIGTAYTVETGLLDESPEPQITTRSEVTTITNNEANIGPEGAGRDINGDLDMYDDIERSSTIIYTVTDGALPGVPGEAALGLWSVTRDFSSVFVDQDGDGVNDADQVVVENGVDTYTYSDFSGTAPDATIEDGAWGPLTADASEAMIAQTRTQISVVASYEETREATIVQVDALDDPAPATLALSRTVEASRTPIASLTRSIVNPAYDSGVDTWGVTGTYGGEEVLGALTYNAAPSDTSVATYTRIGTQAYSVNAAGNVETYTVVGLQDGSILAGATRNVETAPAQSGLSRQASSEADFANPNYEEPSDEAATGVVTLENTGQGVAAALATLTIDGQASGVSLSAGTYDIVITAAAGTTITREVTITADDISDNAVTFSVNTNTNIVTKS